MGVLTPHLWVPNCQAADNRRRFARSGDFEFPDVFVPDQFVHAFQPEPTQPGTLYRLPTRVIYPWTVATVPLGLARVAMSKFLRIAGTRKRRGDAAPLAERELVQSNLG